MALDVGNLESNEIHEILELNSDVKSSKALQKSLEIAGNAAGFVQGVAPPVMFVGLESHEN